MPWNHHTLAVTSCTDDIPIWAVVLAMLLLFLPTKSASSCGEPILKPPANNSSSRYHFQQIFTVLLVKTRKSCQCWCIELIQWQWDNAWDLTKHQNIENPAARVWPNLLRLLSLTPTAKAHTFQNGPIPTSYLVTFSGRTLTYYSNKCVRLPDSTCQHARLLCTQVQTMGKPGNIKP